MSEKSWGARFNQGASYEPVKKGQRPTGSPDWLNSGQLSDWQEEGLSVWNNDEQRIVRLTASETLRLLDQLLAEDDWKTQGVSIKRPVARFTLEHSRRRRKGVAGQVPAGEPLQTEHTLEEIIHLPAEAGADLLELIQANNQQITDLAEKEKERTNRAFRQVWDLVLRSHREQEQAEFDFAGRPFSWERGDQNRWACKHEDSEGSVALGSSHWFWLAFVRRPGFAPQSAYFFELAQAVAWMENELTELSKQLPPAEVQPQPRSREQRQGSHEQLKRKLLAGPYWIEPARLEPGALTYQVLIEFDAEPLDFKTYESFDGQTYRFNERYLGPSKLAAVLGLELDQFESLQPLGENSGWCLFSSLTGYYEPGRAAEQAQKLWDQSQILAQIKSGKIRRARYGYKERETEFVLFLGGCDRPEEPWEKAPSRTEHMQAEALRESLCFALDVDDYRNYLGLPTELISDQQLLEAMHSIRARSKAISPEAVLESKRWLARQNTF